MLDAGLADWAIEMTKVLLLASIGELDRVLLFDALDGDTLRWLMFDDDGGLEHVSSPRDGYDRLASRTPADRRCGSIARGRSKRCAR